MKNTIATRIYDFLKGFPPFQYLAKVDLEHICTLVTVRYLEKDETIFTQDTPYNSLFYVVQQGAIRISTNDGEHNKIVEMCDEGDLFGLRVVIDDSHYPFSAIANEETIVYGIPMESFYSFAKANKAISNYLIATFASKIKDPYALEHSGKLFTEYEVTRPEELNSLQQARYSKEVVQCDPQTTIKEAAAAMQRNNVGSVVVTQEQKPVGVVTTRDLRDAIVTEGFDSTQTVASIMSFPPVCYQPDVSIVQAQLLILRHGISHLVITEDGTPETNVVGVLGKHDLVVSMANNPTQIIKELKRAPKTKDLRRVWGKAVELLRRLLNQNLPLGHILSMFKEFQNVLITRIIELSIKKMGVSPPVDFVWLALGSQGRNEQLLYTDQDNALLFQDVSEERYDETKSYFLKLANRVNKRLHKVGFDYCPADMMASNPLYCMSHSEWEQQFTSWIQNPSPESILKSGIFFDFNPLYGDTSLAASLSKNINSTLENSTTFLRYLAKDALKNPPPVGFFRKFIVEASGEHKDDFDIKSRAMAPLIDAARVLTLSHQLTGISSTVDRYKKLAQLEPQNAELFESCGYAFKALLKFRVKQGLAHNDSGRFINLQALSKAERLKLKRCFKPLRDVQETIKHRFQTQYIF